MSDSSKREEFEKFAAENGMHDLTRMDDTYLRDPAHICWQTWQAAIALNSHDQLVAALRKIKIMTEDRATASDAVINDRASNALAAAGAT